MRRSSGEETKHGIQWRLSWTGCRCEHPRLKWKSEGGSSVGQFGCHVGAGVLLVQLRLGYQVGFLGDCGLRKWQSKLSDRHRTDRLAATAMRLRLASASRSFLAESRAIA